MPRGGRPTALHVSMTPEERATLAAWQLKTSMPWGQVRRARIILLLADGRSITEVARMVDISRRFVYKWVERFQAQGVEGLREPPRDAWKERRQEATP